MSMPDGDVQRRTACPGCGGARLRTLFDMPYADPDLQDYLKRFYGHTDMSRLAGAVYALEQCDACGLVFQRDVPAGGLIDTLYDDWLGEDERAKVLSRHDLESYRELSFQVEALLRQLGRRPADIRVLDFGMGWAEWLQMARAWGCRVAGAERSQARIDHARSIGIPVMAWDDIPGSAFDFINTEQVFEHLAEPRETLFHLARGLRPGGLIRISVPDGRRLHAILSAMTRDRAWEPHIIMPVAPLEHINTFTHATIVEMGRRVGLVHKRPRFGAMLNASSGWFSARGVFRNVARPIYRHIYPRSTVVFLARPDAG